MEVGRTAAGNLHLEELMLYAAVRTWQRLRVEGA